MVFSLWYQMLKYRDVENKDIVNKRLVDILNWKWFKAEQWKFAHEIYQNYTFSEIVREIIMRCDLNNRNDVRKVQLLAGCLTNVDNLFAVDWDGIIWPKTLWFFYKISNSDSFKLLSDNDPCKIKILWYDIRRFWWSFK